MGVSFQDRPVHERAWVALVRIAADILLICVILGCELPFQPGREACAASAPQTAVQEDLDHILRSFLRQDDAESLIPSGSYVFFDILRVDHAAVAERYSVLLLIKIRLIERNDLVCFRRLIVE